MDVSGVTTMREMFRGATSFNQSIDSWDVSNVTNMNGMFFATTSFNQPIGSWDVSSVTDLSNMFRAASAFNQDLNSWNVSNVTEAGGIFLDAEAFNGNISDWDVSSMTNMTSFFNQASAFNQDIQNWNVSSATTMSSMFNLATSFDQDLSSWDVSNVTNMTALFNGSGLTKSNYDKLLNGWSQLTLQDDVPFSAGGLRYCYGADARQSIIDNFNWAFSDGGENCNAFITTWKTDNPGTSDDNQITIPTEGAGYSYDVDWGDGNSDTDVTGDITHTYASAGTYTVAISGDFPRIYFNNEGDGEKLLTVEQWGDIPWTSMERSFYGCSNLTVPATDRPDLNEVTSMARMFFDAVVFNNDINHWDVSNVTDMSNLFTQARLFNQPLNNWDVSNVITMSGLFSSANDFNQDLDQWDVSSVTNMTTMFGDAHDFNGDISAWM